MTLRSTQIVTAIVTIIVTTCASIVTPASAQLLTVCASPAQSHAAPDRFPSRALADALIPLGGRANTAGDALIALWHDENGFDILLNWGDEDQHSLRREGAEILGDSPTFDIVHLIVVREGQLEHFLFDLDERGSGELLRSAAEGADESSVCIPPR